MSECVEREEEGPDKHHIHRPESPTDSCVSKDHPPDFSNEPGPPHTQSVYHRPESPTPSCVSMKSDRSKGWGPNFSNEPGPPNTESAHHRPESPTPSCVSMKSDTSKGWGPNFSNEPEPPHSRSVHHKPESPTPSCVSMKSDMSKGWGPNFSNEPGPPDTKNVYHRPESPTPSCVSMKSDTSKGWGPNFRNEPEPPHSKEKPPRLKTLSQSRSGQTDVSLQEDLKDYKISLNSLDSVTYITEVPSLSSIYTELYITVGESEGVNNQHEVWQLETASKMKTLHEKPINCCDIFKPLLLGRTTPIKGVLTKGIAGIGKTFSVRKFTLDWAKGLENKDVNLLVPFSFRELNLVRDEKHSLLTLIHVFHPTLKKVTTEQLAVWKVAFIFDGLDESRFPLHFDNNDIVSDVTVTSSVDVLLTNLIKGNLLPSALLWITTRPAAANQIPPACVDMATEVQGFTDPQKEEFFRKSFSDEKLASRIISHLKTSKSIHIMCHIPVFCCITATVLEDMLNTDETGQLPKNLTGMYSHFLLVQTKRKKQKYDETDDLNQQQLMEADRKVLLKLGRLAFEQLEKGNIMFYQEDLEECGLDVKDASLYSGVCTEIFKRETVKFHGTVYSFVHLSIQEFLAAVYLFHCFTEKNMKVLEPFLEGSVSSLDDFLKRAIEKALKSRNGHLDLFVRFLHGLPRESNQSLLGCLLGQTENSPESIQRAINNLKEMTTEDHSPERIINIFHCLMEMNDHSVQQEIQQYLKSGDKSKTELSRSQCSAVAFMLQMSEEVLDELDLDTYNADKWGRWRLVPAVRNSRKARLVDCGLTETHFEVVASALSSNPSHLKQLELGYDDLGQGNSLELLCAGLKSPHCCLEILRLIHCWLSERCCEVLASALRSNPSLHLKELDLHFNVLNDSALQLFSGLKTLQVKHGGEDWIKPQLLTRYFSHLTLNTNTANWSLSLSENREVTQGRTGPPPPDHPDRFDHWPQVLCTEGLTGPCYWEVEWNGWVYIAVTYGGISRKGDGFDCLLGANDKSWSLYCYDEHDDNSYTVIHNSKQTALPVDPSGSNRVAVYLDCPLGTLSFYEVCSDSLIHLYTFHNTFSEPLYAGFWLNSSSSSVRLCEQR